MKIMNAVWVLTGLWAHFLALAAYFKFNRRLSHPDSAAKDEKKTGSFSDCCSEHAQDKMYEYMRIGRMMEEEMTDDLPDDFSENERRSRDRENEEMYIREERYGCGGQGGADTGTDTDMEERNRGNGTPGMNGKNEENAWYGENDTGEYPGRNRGDEIRGREELNRTDGLSGMKGGGNQNGREETDGSMKMGGKRPRWISVTLSTLHCGAGCTLGDIIGEWFTYGVPVYIGGSALAGRWVLDFLLALLLGVYFQFAAIRQMERIPAGQAVKRALKADFLSLTSWQIGMYGWMALVHFVFFKNAVPGPGSWIFWFMMQIAMLFGFFFSYPMNSLLLRWGIKKEM